MVLTEVLSSRHNTGKSCLSSIWGEVEQDDNAAYSMPPILSTLDLPRLPKCLRKRTKRNDPDGSRIAALFLAHCGEVTDDWRVANGHSPSHYG